VIPFWRDRKPGPKPPPPEHGVQMKRAGTTWWGQRWIDALLTMSAAYGSRMARGRTYARRGRTHDVEVAAGVVRAKVTGSRPEPYDIEIRIAALSDPTWDAAIQSMAASAELEASLLAGRMPERIDEAFRAAGASLFPAQTKDLTTECSCPDWANPCKHVAATHYVLGECFDRDPFLLFELRGRPRDRVLADLRAARGGNDSPPAAEVDSVSLRGVRAEAYDLVPGGLPPMQFTFANDRAADGVLARMGRPAAWQLEEGPAEVLGAVLGAAAQRARGVAGSGE